VNNRRVEPRIRFDLKETAKVEDDERVPIFDISKGGACFLSVQEYQVGDMITVSTGPLTMTMKVLESMLMEVDRDLGDFRYKVRCQHVGGDLFEAEPFFRVVAE
jgi:hypothetical protein